MVGATFIRHARAFRRFDNGTAAVEFAMMLPLLLMLLFLGIETGRLLTDFHAVSKSVRDATRYLTRVGLTCPGGVPSTGPLSSYINNAADETTARNLAMTGSVTTPSVSSDYLLPYWTSAAALSMTVTCVSNGGVYQGIYAARPMIPRITVNANVPFTFMWGTAFSSVASLTMDIRHIELHVGE